MVNPDLSLAYTQTHEFSCTLRGRQLSFCSKAGLPFFDQVTPSAGLIAEGVALESAGDILYLGCGHGAAACALAQAYPTCQFWLLDQNIIALNMSQRSAALNSLQNVGLLPEEAAVRLPEASYAAALIDLPKGRKLAQRWLALAYLALQPGAALYLAGANDLGILSAVKDAQALFGPGAVLGYKKGNRLLRFIRRAADPEAGFPAPADACAAYWCQPGIQPRSWHEFTAHTPFGRLPLRSLPGVFSYDRLDEGTHLLLQHLEVPTGGSVLDAGCGTGIIGICAGLGGAGSVDLLDADIQAVACARENVLLNQLPQKGAACRVISSDLLEAVQERRYDLVAANPPFHSGKQTNFQIVQALAQQSRACLNPGGKLILVANLFLRYERLLGELFDQVQCLAETQKYHVLQASLAPPTRRKLRRSWR